MTRYTTADFRRARRVADALLADQRQARPAFAPPPGMNGREVRDWCSTATRDPLALGAFRVRLIRYLVHRIAAGWWPR